MNMIIPQDGKWKKEKQFDLDYEERKFIQSDSGDSLWICLPQRKKNSLDLRLLRRKIIQSDSRL